MLQIKDFFDGRRVGGGGRRRFGGRPGVCLILSQHWIAALRFRV